MNRRGFLTGLLAAPVVIRTPGLLMSVKALAVEPWPRNTAEFQEEVKQLLRFRINWRTMVWDPVSHVYVPKVSWDVPPEDAL